MPPPAPRPFRLRAIEVGTTFCLLFGGIWAGVGLLLTIIFTAVGGPFWNDLILDRRGVEAQATPVSVEGTRSYVNGLPVYRIGYRFIDAEGRWRTGQCGTTSASLIARADRHEGLTIRYDREAPALSRLAGERASFFGPFV